jgi:hypothetical protein
MDSQWAVVGAPTDSSGAAYIYLLTGTTATLASTVGAPSSWVQNVKLTPGSGINTAVSTSGFGRAVAIYQVGPDVP